jgi:Dolichyl-phosphate-mannose-protein mannosyltransferase
MKAARFETVATHRARPRRGTRLLISVRGFLRTHRWTLPAFGLFTLLRIPSFLEPHWYTDEGGYAAAARSLLNGRVLYSQVWNNKPPLHLWTIALDLAVFRASEAGLHLLTFVSGALTLAALAYVALPVLGKRRACVALVLAAVALGTPIFDAELALPESLLIAPATWAAAIVIRRVWAPSAPAVRHWPVIAGGCAAAAIAYQQTAVADAGALLLILVLSPRVSWREVAQYASTVLAITTAWVVAAVLTAGASAVAFALVGFYVPYSASVLPANRGAFLQLALTLMSALVLICAGAAVARRSSDFLWGAWVWAGAELLVAGAAQMPYAHFLTASVVPVILAVCSLPLPRLQRVSPVRVLGVASLLAGVSIAGLVARVAGVDWIPELASAGTVHHPDDLATYYGGAVQVLTRQNALSDLQDLFDDRVEGDRKTSAWIKSHGLSGRTAVAWSSDAWLYVMADLPLSLPTPPIYNDEVLLGDQGQVAKVVADIAPDMVVTTDDALHNFPEVKPLLAQRYRMVDREQWNAVWLRDDIPLQGTQ